MAGEPVTDAAGSIEAQPPAGAPAAAWGERAASPAARALAERLGGAHGSRDRTAEQVPAAAPASVPPTPVSNSPADGLPAATDLPPEPVPVDARGYRPRRSILVRAALALALVLVAAALGGLGYLAHSNKSRATLWEERAALLERNTTALNRLLVRRSGQLNARTGELNAMARKVQRQQAALSRSQDDVAALARRQRELANEKAQVEDSRAQLATQAAALEAVASSFVACNDNLTELLGYVLDDDYISASYVISRAVDSCDQAEGELAGYNAAYGG